MASLLLSVTMSQLTNTNATPMMQQWHRCKDKAKEALLLFRMGDFYEAFYDDAKTLAQTLNLTLTQRQGIPMSGIPYHAFNNYIDRLLEGGIKVAIAEQMEDPKKAKGLVKRGLTRIITPGTLILSNLLDAKTHNYIVSICEIGKSFGIAYLDFSTSEFKAFEFQNIKELSEEILRLNPKEILSSKRFHAKYSSFFEELNSHFKPSLTTLENYQFDAECSLDTLLRHFNVLSLDGFGLKGMSAAINCAGALLTYLSEVLFHSIESIKNIQKMESQDYLVLDHITLNHLEIIDPQQSQNKKHTLLALLDQTQTAMGGRHLREWVQKPLIDLSAIHKRQDAIECFLRHTQIRDLIEKDLASIDDIERLMIKIASNLTSAKDFRALGNSLKAVPKLKKHLKELSSSLLKELENDLISLEELTGLIDEALVEEPPLKLGDGNTFKQGFNKALDEITALSQGSKNWLASYQNELRAKTQIKTLKVGYNRVFGYYIEVSKAQATQMPASFQKRQTLTNNERFISEELKKFETKMLTAQEKLSEIEKELFEDLRIKIRSFQNEVLSVSKSIAHIDSLLSLALLANHAHYVKPIVDNSPNIQIQRGRHPILDKLSNFISNDTFLDDQEQRLHILTGPNMAGKSTYIRQVALIVILAQIGSFVPAQSAHIGIVEKIFSRIGASDDLARGQSTFMVEMVETANILNNVTPKSLVILDEIGRGTSTYDGIAIAQSTAEYLLQSKCKTLFATHYSELTQLKDKTSGTCNYTVSVHEEAGKITFLYKIIKGSTDKSYGIHVAQLAGLPPSLILRANEILKNLEKDQKSTKKTKCLSEQISFLPQKKPCDVEMALKQIDLENLTPIEAFLKLKEIKEKHT